MPDPTETTGVADATTPDVSSAADDLTPRPEGLPEGTPETEPSSTEPVITPYTDEELVELVKTDGTIDRKRLTPAQDVLRKQFESAYTPKFQEAARLREEAERKLAEVPKQPEVYFPKDEGKNNVFKDYLSDPGGILRDINAEIGRLELVTPYNDMGEPDQKTFREARNKIAYWQGIKDEFALKREQILTRRQSEDAIAREYGAEARALEAYALTLGFSADDFRDRPAVRKAVKQTYDIANAGKKADGKEVKPTPPKTVVQGGKSPATSSVEDKYFDPKISTAERIAISQRLKAKGPT